MPSRAAALVVAAVLTVAGELRSRSGRVLRSRHEKPERHIRRSKSAGIGGRASNDGDVSRRSFSNLHGGINTNNAADYRGLLSLAAEYDLEQFDGGPGGSVFAMLQSGHGRGISLRHVGDFQQLSNIDGPEFTQLSELWWYKEFDAPFAVRIGKQDVNADFAHLHTADPFVQSSFGLPPTIPMPSYPAPSCGTAAFFDSERGLSVSTGVFEAAAQTPGLLPPRLLDGDYFAIGQVSWYGEDGSRQESTMQVHVGAWSDATF